MRKICVAVAGIVLLLSLGARAEAGNYPHSRQGFFVGFGLGGGTANVDVVGLVGEGTEDGGAGSFRLGGAIRDDLLLGLETSVWVKSEQVGGVEATWTLGLVAGAVTWFPGNQGFYLRGGGGVATSSIEVRRGGLSASMDESGFGLLGAAGYEWRLTPSFALGPQVEYVYLGINGDLVNTAGYVSGSLQLNWYW